jgi:hypothetical protein
MHFFELTRAEARALAAALCFAALVFYLLI